MRGLGLEEVKTVGRALGCTVSAARVRMHRAMQQLNATFTRMNVRLSLAQLGSETSSAMPAS